MTNNYEIRNSYRVYLCIGLGVVKMLINKSYYGKDRLYS